MITAGICQETQFNLEFDALPLDYRETYVKWNVVDDPDKTCRKLNANGPKENGIILACALNDPQRNVCNIYTSKHLNLAILGHELRHCFEKDWHQ